jgi:hypothetical protein
VRDEQGDQPVPEGGRSSSALFYVQGRGTNQDFAEAARWFPKCGRAGGEEAKEFVLLAEQHPQEQRETGVACTVAMIGMLLLLVFLARGG